MIVLPSMTYSLKKKKTAGPDFRGPYKKMLQAPLFHNFKGPYKILRAPILKGPYNRILQGAPIEDNRG